MIKEVINKEVTKKMTKFLIYKIFDKTTQEPVYIGSTCRNLKIRMNEHKNHSMIHIYEHVLLNGGWDNFGFEALHEAEVEDEKDRFRCERDYVEDLKPILNLKRPIRTHEEHLEDLKRNIIKYREENRDHLLEYSRKYREENHEACLERCREYKRNNKDKIKEYYEANRENIIEKKKEYQKKYAENHPDRIKASAKLYREKNKDKLAESSRKYKENHADYINCECGKQYTCYNKGQHFKTKFHQNYIIATQ